MKLTMKSIKLFGILIVVCLLAFGTLGGIASAETSCNFTRTLSIDDEGEDVRCLQKYLNNLGFKISNEGPGSTGKETSTFKNLTKTALAKWQTANGISPATGNFGPASRQAYDRLMALAEAARTQAPQTTSIVNPDPVVVVAPVVKSVAMENAKTAILKAMEAIENAEDEIDGSSESANKIEDAKEGLEDARVDFLKTIKAYLSEQYERASTIAKTVFEEAEEAYKDAGGETDEDEIDDLINTVEDEIDAVKVKIKTADKAGKDVDESENLIDEAENLIDKADTKLDEGDTEEAEDLAKDARNKAEDAEDAIGEKSNDLENAEDAIADAKDAIKKAKAEIREAQDDDKNTNDAEDLLDDAENLYDKAREEFDDEDYDNAKDLAEDAEKKAEDAIDEL